MREAATAKLTGGFSPMALTLAYLDWAIHLAAAPGKQLELAAKAARKAARLGGHVGAFPAEGRSLHRAAAWRPPLRGAGMEQAALWLHGAGVPAQPAMVAQRHA
jgi:hypothetical protein